MKGGKDVMQRVESDTEDISYSVQRVFRRYVCIVCALDNTKKLGRLSLLTRIETGPLGIRV